MKKYLVITEGHFTGSKEYWKQEARFEGEFDYEVIGKIREYLKKQNYENYKVYSLTEVVM